MRVDRCNRVGPVICKVLVLLAGLPFALGLQFGPLDAFFLGATHAVKVSVLLLHLTFFEVVSSRQFLSIGTAVAQGLVLGDLGTLDVGLDLSQVWVQLFLPILGLALDRHLILTDHFLSLTESIIISRMLTRRMSLLEVRLSIVTPLAFFLIDFCLEGFLQFNLGFVEISHLARISSLEGPFSCLLFHGHIDLAVKETLRRVHV